MSGQDFAAQTPFQSEQSPSHKRWKARFIVSVIMLILAFINSLIIEIHPLFWIFTYIMAGIDAILTIWLVWYVRQHLTVPFPGNLWHMVLHWIGLVAALYLIAVFVR